MSYIGKLKLGTQVLVSNKDKFVDKKGVVKFVGKLDGKNQQFIGIELQTADGTHAGVFQGKQYFKAKQKHGMFAKPKAIKLADGSPISNLLEAQKVKSSTTTTAKTVNKLGQKKPVPATSKNTVATKQVNKLSNQIQQVDNTQFEQELNGLKEQLEIANKKISELESTDSQQEITALKTRLRELQDLNRKLQLDKQKVQISVGQGQEAKMNQLKEKIDFFNNQKEFQQKQKADLKKVISRLQAQLQQQEQKDELLQKLTFKIENLETKNQKLKQDLQVANTQLKNAKILGGGSQKQSKSTEGQIEELTDNIKILNQTITLLQSDLNQEKDKNKLLQQQAQNVANKSNEFAKLQRKLKSRDEQLEAVKAQLQVYADAASFAQKLTLDMLKKQQQLKQSTGKLNEYLKKIQSLQAQISEGKEMIQLQGSQLQQHQQEIQKILKEKEEQQNHIGQLNKQIQKYKSKIAQLTQNNQSLLITSSQILQNNQDQSILKTYVNTDIYQHKYYQALKSVQTISQKYLQKQLQSCSIRNMVGVQILNLIDTIPQTFTQKFYPDVTKSIVEIKSANDKLYLLFQTISNYFKQRQEIYTKQNSQLAHWMIMILEQIPLLFGQLTKIELSLTTAETEQQISDILSNTIIKDQIRKIQIFSSELLQRFATENIDASIDIDAFIEPVQNLDKICSHCRKLQFEYQMRIELSVETMRIIHKIFQMILIFKEQSQVAQNAQVDTMIQNFLKTLLVYLQECCTNPHLRIKSQMKQYLSGIGLIVKIFQQIQINETITQLSSLYSDIEDIRLLKQTLLTTQFHIKQLISDLDDIVYPNALSKIQCKLPGKVWQQRTKLIKGQLSRFQQIVGQKEDLQAFVSELKKKIIILEKQIKDGKITKQLYEKRIGELQLKVQQASSIQNQYKRLSQKIKSYQDTNRLIQDQLQSQNNKKKELQEELKRLKEKYDAQRTETLVKNKKQKLAQSSGAHSQDVTSLTIFKNVLNQCHSLRNIDLKKKILQIKQSPLLLKLNPQQNSEKNQLGKAANLRRKAIDCISDLKIIDPRNKNQKNISIVDSLSDLRVKANLLDFTRIQKGKQKQKLSELTIGEFFLKDFKDELNIKVSTSKTKILSF